jgi:hypothetical protein
MSVKTKNISIIFLIILFVLLCHYFECKSNLPNEKQFKNWLTVIYTHETGLKADKIYINHWERSPKKVYREFPGLDGLEVEATVFSCPSKSEYSTELEFLSKTSIHHVYCRYHKFNNKWSLHASSWGGGYWKEDPQRWGYLVEECKFQVKKFKEEYRNELLKKK